MFRIILAVALFLLLIDTGFSQERKKKNSGKNLSVSTDNCQLSDRPWLTYKESYDVRKAVNLASDLELAAQADYELISGDGKGKFNSVLAKKVNKLAQGDYQVSQDFLQAYTSKRDAICAVLALIENKKFQSLPEDVRKQAALDFLQLSKDLGAIKESEKKKDGDTYIVNSNNQSGGITTGKVVFENPQIIVTDEIKATDIDDNVKINIDTIAKLITVQPKIGKWSQTFIGILASEKDLVNPKFINQIGSSMSTEEGTFNIGDTMIYGHTTKGYPQATNELYHGIEYVKLPSCIFYGDKLRKILVTKIEFKK